MQRKQNRSKFKASFFLTMQQVLIPTSSALSGTPYTMPVMKPIDIKSPNEQMLKELRADAEESKDLLRFQKDFLMDDMTSPANQRHEGSYVIEPEEAFSSIIATSDEDARSSFEELKKEYLKKKNWFFASIWKETILPNMNAAAFDDFVRKMERMDLGPDFVPCLHNQVQSYKAHVEEVQEMRAQREAGELDEGQ